MKTIIILKFLFLITCNTLFAQINYSSVSYICVTKLQKGPVHDGLNTLYFENNKSLFTHNDFPKENSYLEKGNATVFVKGDPEGLPVFINLTDQILYYKSEYGSVKENFIFKESLPKIDWQIIGETKKISEFTCTKATGTFGGRVYDVWFTPEIPVSLGPYKLWGLPGIILEAQSRDGIVSYAFQSYESPASEKIKIEKPTQGKEINWEDFKKYIINRLLSVEALSSEQYTTTNDDPPADYEIERNKFTIISEYKKQRAAKQKK